MILAKKSSDFYGIPFLVIALIIMLAFYSIRWFDKKENEPSAIISRIEKILSQKEKQTNHLIDQLSSRNDLFSSASKEVLSRETGITILFYQHDTLKYWTGNSVPGQPSALQVKSFPSKPVVKLGNGWYRVIEKKNGDILSRAFIRITQEYPFQNDYLKNGMDPSFHGTVNLILNLYPGIYNIHSSQGTFLFSFTVADTKAPARWPVILFLLFLFAWSFVILFQYRLYRAFSHLFPGRITFMLSFLADLLILRLLQFGFRWPGALYETSLFSPSHYFCSPVIPSLGDLLINTLLILFASIILYFEFHARPSVNIRHKKYKYLIAAFLTFFSLVFLTGISLLIRSLVEDSTIPLNLQDLTSLTIYSVAALTVIALHFLAFYLFLAVFSHVFRQLFSLAAKPFITSFSGVLICLILYSLLSTVILNNANIRQEKEKRRLIAMKLAARRNPVTEDSFAETARLITADSLLQHQFKTLNNNDSIHSEQKIINYISKNYFSGYWNNYSVQITLCRPGKMLRIQPQDYLVSCNEYFLSLVNSFGKTTSFPNLYYLDYGYGNESYLAMLNSWQPLASLVIEFSLKQAYKDLGYPELLVDRSISDLPDLSSYSYGYYQHGQLVRRVGQYAYGFELAAIADTTRDSYFFDSGGLNHFFYKIDRDNVMIIGKPMLPILGRISPFSYLFIIFSLVALTSYLVFRFRVLKSLSSATLRNRLQIAFLSVILSSFILVGIVITIFLTRLNAEKDKENLLERALSVMVEIQHKFGSYSNLSAVPQTDMSNALIKLSNVFFSDINIYNTDGMLVGSTRPQIFEEQLISDLMNPFALKQLQYGSQSMIVCDELIGKHRYFSAYLPMFNDQNQRSGYINLPYFSRQAELRGEVSSFMVAFINIYVLFILIGVIISFIISRYLTAPLKMLAEKIGGTSFDKKNEKIEWKRKDEVGLLVAEYNRMLDELLVSAEKLASSERESAWREMARQVAHEIKNPLTPMKLSVQYLEKAWDEHAPDWDQRLKRFSAALVEQIDSLSTIATEFSDFAKMPVPVNEKLGLNEMIRSSLSLYHDVSPEIFSFSPSEPEKYVFCDRKQCLRVFTNLINNALQAIDQQENGKISITVSTTKAGYEIRITDNGPGIPQELQGKIFHPNFTTKSGGTGLGLAIVKEILTSQGGTISFVSEPGSGTTFIIILPLY
ncbi:MAG TPA: ATP-binding protein [Bacteroidales bacterium]|nr:ATP-binding protein [Bacteroidales bacterium]